MKARSATIAVAATFVALLVGGGYYWPTRAPKDDGTCRAVKDSARPAAKLVNGAASYSGVAHCDALTLLKMKYAVGTKDFGPGLGEFVEMIDGLKPAAEEFWAFYVNGKSSTVGASNYITQEGDVIEWKLQKIR